MGGAGEKAELKGAEGDSEDDGEVEGEGQAVLAAMRQGAQAEEKDDRGEGAAEAQRPVKASCCGNEVGLFDGLAEGVEVAKEKGGRGSGGGEENGDLGAGGEPVEGGREDSVKAEAEGVEPEGG